MWDRLLMDGSIGGQMEKIDNRETMISNAVEWANDRINGKEYMFKCLAFVEDAYEQSNSIEMFGGSSATESAAMYGCVSGAVPERGSFVFYRSSGPFEGVIHDWGHVGLCVGDGMVIHAWDVIRIDDYLAVQNLKGAPGWTSPEYIGWTPPEVFLKGHVQKKY